MRSCTLACLFAILFIFSSCSLVRKIQETTNAIDSNIAAVHSATQAIEANKEIVVESTDTIRGNQTAIAATNEAIAENRRVIQESTDTILANRRAVDETNSAISQNRQVIQDSTEAIKTNARVVGEATAMLANMKVDKAFFIILGLAILAFLIFPTFILIVFMRRIENALKGK